MFLPSKYVICVSINTPIHPLNKMLIFHCKVLRLVSNPKFDAARDLKFCILFCCIDLLILYSLNSRIVCFYYFLFMCVSEFNRVKLFIQFFGVERRNVKYTFFINLLLAYKKFMCSCVACVLLYIYSAHSKAFIKSLYLTSEILSLKYL